MKQFSEELKSEIFNMICQEIGSKGFDGLTYVIKSKDDKDCYKYMKVVDMAHDCGYDKDEVIRVVELSNCVVYDIDLGVVKSILSTIVAATCKIADRHDETYDDLKNSADKRRDREIKRLAKLIKQSMEQGANNVSIALYNMNKSNTIEFFSEENGQKSLNKVRAFALRHEDIKTLNEQILMKNGVKVNRVALEYMLPNARGVKATIGFEEI